MSQARDYLFNLEAKNKIFEGIQLMNDVVGVTLGPCGRNAAIHLGKQLVHMTKDGVTVAEDVHSADKWKQMGCQLVREASQNCNEASGDGTTSALVMAHSMCQQALHLPFDANVIKMKRGMEKAIEACLTEIKRMSIPCVKREDFQKVAFISSQDNEIAEKVTDVFMQSGEHGCIDIERSDDVGLTVEHTDGFVMEKGWIMNHAQRIVLEDVPVLVTDKDIKYMQQIGPIMELIAKQGMRKLFIVCDNLSGEALGMLVNNNNNLKNPFHTCAVKVPSYGKYRIDVMRDVCAATGAQFVSEEENIRLDKVTLEHLGRARRVTIDKERTIIVSLDTIDIRKRVADRVQELEEAEKKDNLDNLAKDEVERRLATLTNGVSIIKFGAQTEVERHEKKHRIEDAVRAVQSAREEGVIIGGGSGYLRCISAIDQLVLEDKDENRGAAIIRKALRSITLRVLEVAGIEDKELIVSKIIEAGGNAGYDFKNVDIADMVEIGVIEPAKVVRCVIQNAASCAMAFLSMEVAMADSEPTHLEQFAAAIKP